MMRILATKDTHEREDEEAERLVKPSPKVKPPRKDLRRQTTESETDPDLAGDPDLSLNYKNVGGSLVDRVALRFVETRKGPGKAKFVTVRDKEQDKTVSVPETTVKNNPSRYQKVQGQPSSPSDQEGKEPPRPLSLEKAKPPQTEDKAPKEEEPPSQPPGQPEQKTEDRFPDAKEAPKKPASPEQAEAHKKLRDAVGENVEEFEKFLDSLPTTDTDPVSGKTLIYDPEAKERVSLDSASPKAIEAVVTKYLNKTRSDSLAKTFESFKDDPKLQKVLLDLAFVGGRAKEEGEVEGPVAKKIRQLQKSGDPLESMSISKNLPELKGVKLPDSIKNLQDLVDSAASVVERFKAESLTSDSFKEFASGLSNADVDEDGNPVFLDKSKGKKKLVPFDKLSPKAQQDLIEKFEKNKGSQEKRQFVKDNPKVKEILDQLRSQDSRNSDDGEEADDSVASRIKKLVDGGEDPDDLLIKKHVPELAGLKLPDDVVTVGDLIQMSKDVGVPKPKPREYSNEEKQYLQDTLYRYLPMDEAAQAAKLSPQDQEQFLESYKKLSDSDPSSVRKLLKSMGGLPDDVEALEPPKTVKVEEDGKEKDVDFDSLPPEEQAQRFQEYQNEARALQSLAKASEVDHHIQQGLPEGLSRTLVYDTDRKPTDIFNEIVRSPSGESPPSPKQLKKIFKGLNDDQKEKASAYYKARDYQDVSEKYIRGGLIHEQMPPSQITRLLGKATNELKERAKNYPGGSDVNTAAALRNKVLKHLETLKDVGSVHEESYKEVDRWVREQDADEYDEKMAEWESNLDRDLLGRKKKPVPRPQMPAGYHSVRESKPKAKKKKSLFDTFKSFLPGRSKSASYRVLERYLFCEPSELMPVTTHNSREAVYWGVEPYPKGHEGFAEYPEWEQAQARDLGAGDEKALLDAAKAWLKEPILDLATMGEDWTDARMRAALDFALQTTENGKYGVGLHPELYNKLLARLSVRTRSASVFLYTKPSMRASAMFASSEIRRYAAKIANESPDVAFGLLALSDKIAQQEQEEQQAQAPQEQQKQAQEQQEQQEAPQAEAQQKQAAYTALRSAVIRTAGANPNARQALQGVLRLIQKLG